MNANTLLATVVAVACISIVVISFAPNRKAQEIQACMSQPNMQYVRDSGSHYNCIPIEQPAK
jgi:hypothetical protein